VRVADDDVADHAVASQEDADLAVEPSRGFGEVAGELGGDDLPRVDAAAVGALEGADLRSLDAPDVAVDLWDGSLLSRQAAQCTVGGA
jgi:hypothetical protein